MKRNRLTSVPATTVALAAIRLGEALREARESRGESQDAAASAVGIWQKGLSRIERGLDHTLSLATLLRLLDHYGLQFAAIERDMDVARYRVEKVAASLRCSPQRELFAQAKAEYQRAISGNVRRERRAARSA